MAVNEGESKTQECTLGEENQTNEDDDKPYQQITKQRSKVIRNEISGTAVYSNQPPLPGLPYKGDQQSVTQALYPSLRKRHKSARKAI